MALIYGTGTESPRRGGSALEIRFLRLGRHTSYKSRNGAHEAAEARHIGGVALLLEGTRQVPVLAKPGKFL